jgi:hypothetical protein
LATIAFGLLMAFSFGANHMMLENPPFAADSLHMLTCDVYSWERLSASIPFRQALCRSGLHPAADSQEAQWWTAGHIIHEDGAVQASPRNRGEVGQRFRCRR